MVKKIADNIVFVPGKKQSAIYDFEHQKVYSINEFGTKIMKDYFSEDFLVNEEQQKFLTEVMKLFNLSEIVKEDYVFEKKKPKQLNHVWLEVTQKCTSRCIHCYEGNEHKEAQMPLNFKEWQKIVDDLSFLKCKSVQFIGGEPSLYKDLPKLIDYVAEKNIEKISIFTNLYSISKELMHAIIKNKLVVHFSIYGSDAEHHDRITQVPGSFNRLIDNVKKLKENGIELISHVVVMKENEKETDKIYDLLHQMNIENIRYDEIRKVYGGCQDKHLVTNSKVTMNKPNFKANLNWFSNAYYNNTCWYGKCVISTDGNVYPCEFENNIIYGNIRQQSIIDIIRDCKIDKYWYLDFTKIEYCKDCEFRFACRDCRPLAYAQKGNILEKNPRCKYNPYLGIWEDD